MGEMIKEIGAEEERNLLLTDGMGYCQMVFVLVGSIIIFFILFVLSRK